MSISLRAKRTGETRDLILQATRALLVRNGPDVTLDAVAREVGVTKQSVLYHFSSKERLLGELALAHVVAEAEAMTQAVRTSRGLETLHRFARANLAWHRADFERLRMSYLRSQVVPGAHDAYSEAERRERVYPSTAAMYDAVEARVRLADGVSPRVDVRRLVVAVHIAAIGFATMAGMLDAVGTSFKSPMEDYLEELLRPLLRGAQR